MNALKKPLMFLSLLSACCFLGSLPVFGQEIEITNIQTNPPQIHVGDSFRINATIINNSPDVIFFYGGCTSPLSVTFDKNVEIGQEMGCLALINANLKPGDNTTVTGPSSGILYTANSTGITNANVIFSYQAGNKTESTISKLFPFVISEPAPVPEFPFAPVVLLASISSVIVFYRIKFRK